MWDRLNRAEAAAIAESPFLPEDAPPSAVIALTTAGRGGALWLLCCLVEAVRPGGNRRTARVAAQAVVTALVLSHVVKRLLPRRARPEKPGGPARRDLPEQPDSSSFPSAHAATASAFLVVLLAHDRRRAVRLAPAVLTAVYGRVRTRVHWPTDLAAGVLVGTATAVLIGRAARRR